MYVTAQTMDAICRWFWDTSFSLSPFGDHFFSFYTPHFVGFSFYRCNAVSGYVAQYCGWRILSSQKKTGQKRFLWPSTHSSCKLPTGSEPKAIKDLLEALAPMSYGRFRFSCYLSYGLPLPSSLSWNDSLKKIPSKPVGMLVYFQAKRWPERAAVDLFLFSPRNQTWWMKSKLWSSQWR